MALGGILSALARRAPAALAQYQAGRTERQQYDREQAFRDQQATLAQQAKERALALQMEELAARREDTSATRDLNERYRRDSLTQAYTLAQQAAELRKAEAEAARQAAAERAAADRESRELIAREGNQTRSVIASAASKNGVRATIPTEGERKAGAFYTSGKQAYDVLENLLASDKKVPNWLEQQLSKAGAGAGNVMTTADYRRMRQAALQLSDAWLRYTSGAAVPETEVERFAASFIPQAGDDDVTLQQKANSRRTIMDALRVGAGRALPQQVSEPGGADGLDAWATQTLARIRGGKGGGR